MRKRPEKADIAVLIVVGLLAIAIAMLEALADTSDSTATWRRPPAADVSTVDRGPHFPEAVGSLAPPASARLAPSR